MEDMEKWIEEMEEEAVLKINSEWRMKGDLFAVDAYGKAYVSFVQDATDMIQLRGYFSIDQLTALIKHMKKYQGEG